MKEVKKYKMIQVSEETHQMIKDYCDMHGFKITGFISALVKKTIRKNEKVN